MDASTWERHISAIQAIFSYERNRNWWRNYGSTALDREFVTEVNAVLEQTPVTQVQVQDIHRSFIEGPGGNSGGATQ